MMKVFRDYYFEFSTLPQSPQYYHILHYCVILCHCSID